METEKLVKENEKLVNDDVRIKKEDIQKITQMYLYQTLQYAVQSDIELYDSVGEIHKGVNRFFDRFIRQSKKEIVRYYFDKGKTLEEISAEYNIDKTEVRNIILAYENEKRRAEIIEKRKESKNE